MATQQELFVNKALSYKGYGCSHFINAMKSYGATYGDAWCAWFVSTIAKECGLTNIIPITGGAGCFPREGVPKGMGKWYEGGTTPQPGDIITFCWNGYGYYPGQDRYFSDHVGIVEKIKGGYVYTIEGNAGGSNDTSSVKRKCYAIKNIYINGYYRPNWTSVDKVAVTTPTAPKATGKDSIKAVQRWLNNTYGTHCTIDGIYGEQTKSAIVGALQCYLNQAHKARLCVDGIMGPATKAAVPVISIGANGRPAYILQAALICHGYDTGGFDGDFGTKTLTAVKDWQKKHGLEVDGQAGPETFYSLLK